MPIKRVVLMPLLALAAILLLSGCSARVDRNEDGSLLVETTMSETSIQRQLSAALSSEKINDVNVDLRNGWIQVNGSLTGENGRINEIQFRLDLGVADGHLTAAISDVQINGRSVPASQTAGWNERISAQLEQTGRNSERASLQGVAITDDLLTMQWRLETN
jgi:hypothetical protein